ncbi:Ribosomal large subunit pseudouridine synthase A [compost metagenome]|uniref:RluA family pseudouridine synthase n=1 Tax=Variovorax boronicumulans TaxID=436515 RepID=UPI00085BCBB7|nr:RluA family pseudouridine synthase [Variovorax boronicumulans]OEZ30648.1 pseudouridine synthase [Variovorax boronicumulans]GER15257.1 RluA family pseudouridine synthase [Variovorax boronicumulans]
MTASPPDLLPVHEDAHLLVLDKPAGLLCVPGRGEDKQDCLSARAQRQWPDALIVHRLDMGTSGLVVMARGLEMQRALSAAFADREVHKRYEAVVDGVMPQRDDWSLIDAPLMADWPRRPLQKIDPAGKPSLTRWRALSSVSPPGGPAATHVLLEPLTGRSHQLRVHLLSIGHPILGDALYGDAALQARAPRLLLHARELGFVHPATREPLHFERAAGFVLSGP